MGESVTVPTLASAASAIIDLRNMVVLLFK
jgi:hypothetical protein